MKKKKQEETKRNYAIYEDEPEETIVSIDGESLNEEIEEVKEEKKKEKKSKKPKKEKKNTVENAEGESTGNNKAILLVFGFLALVMLLTVGVIGYSLFGNSNGGGSGNPVVDVINPNDKIDMDKLFCSGSKIYAPDGAPGLYDANKSLSTMNEINGGILKHYEELIESELSYLNGQTDEKHFKTDLAAMKESIKIDIDLLGSYKLMYTNLDGSELYESTVKRYKNFLDLVDAIKPSMKREKMIETTNRYIELEQSYNKTMKEALKKMLKANGIKYTETENSIKYDIPANLLKPDSGNQTDATDYD